MPDVVNELLAAERAIDKLGARGISVDEAEQVPHNPRGGQDEPACAAVGFSVTSATWAT